MKAAELAAYTVTPVLSLAVCAVPTRGQELVFHRDGTGSDQEFGRSIADAGDLDGDGTVSYTHLTLPTIYSV